MPGIYHIREGKCSQASSMHGRDEVCILLLIKSPLCCSKMWDREKPEHPGIGSG